MYFSAPMGKVTRPLVEIEENFPQKIALNHWPYFPYLNNFQISMSNLRTIMLVASIRKFQRNINDFKN